MNQKPGVASGLLPRPDGLRVRPVFERQRGAEATLLAGLLDVDAAQHPVAIDERLDGHRLSGLPDLRHRNPAPNAVTVNRVHHPKIVSSSVVSVIAICSTTLSASNGVGSVQAVGSSILCGSVLYRRPSRKIRHSPPLPLSYSALSERKSNGCLHTRIAPRLYTAPKPAFVTCFICPQKRAAPRLPRSISDSWSEIPRIEPVTKLIHNWSLTRALATDAVRSRGRHRTTYSKANSHAARSAEIPASVSAWLLSPRGSRVMWPVRRDRDCRIGRPTSGRRSGWRCHRCGRASPINFLKVCSRRLDESPELASPLSCAVLSGVHLCPAPVGGTLPARRHVGVGRHLNLSRRAAGSA
jgi:hypothetical protein